MEARVAGFDEAALVHELGAVFGAFRDVAGDQHDGGLAAIGRDQRRAALRQAGAAGDHGEADLAGGARIAVGHGHGHGLMTGVVGLHLFVAAQRAPEPHVAVAHQAEKVGDPLGAQRERDCFVGFHGFSFPFADQSAASLAASDWCPFWWK